MRNFRVRALVFLVGLLLASQNGSAQTFSDMFAGRQLLTNTNFTVTGSNTNATVEPGEPLHAGKVGGHSVWISWQAPADGLVTVSTAGSTFDTLLAVYTTESESDHPSVRSLEQDVADDDYGGLVTSAVQFGANSNSIYEIAVDGFNGAVGDITLQLAFTSAAGLQPTILNYSGDQALQLGAPLLLTVYLVPSLDLQFQWYLNGHPVAGQDDDSVNPTLVIPSLQRTNLGFYSLRFELNDDSFFSSAIEVQVNSEGQKHVLARNKIADAAQSRLVGGVTLGYNGTQIFNTTNAVVDTNAPLICGVAPGPAYWFAYQAPTNGIISVDTTNSAFPTLLAAFTYTGILNDYTDLVSVACDNNGGGTGTNFSNVQFAVTAGQNYFIVVGGVNGARGIVHLNYSLAATPETVPPVLTSQPQSLVVAQRTAVTLNVTAGGTAPLAYQWWKNNAPMSQQTNATLLIRSPQSRDTGIYSVVITNFVGAVTSAPASFSVVSASMISFDSTATNLVTAFPAVRGLQYAVDSAASLAAGSWANFTNVFPDYGGMIWLTNAITDSNGMFIRVHSP